MHSLDSKEYVVRNDPKGMYALTVAFADQCKQALEIAQASALPNWNALPDNVILTGLGGSAAGGDFVKALFEAYAKVPFSVNRDYHLPAYAGSGTLVFATSYSGNTEETLSSYADAKKAGCSIIVVTSGGKLAEYAAADGFPVIRIPAGQPPRTALGYLLIPVVYACEKLGLIPNQDYAALDSVLREVAAKCGVEVPFEQNPTKQLAEALFGGIGILYGLGQYQGLVASRWKSQINENSKNMVFSHTFPELNHNEILGWVAIEKQNCPNWVLVGLQDGTESAKMKRRQEMTFQLIGDKATHFSVMAPGVSMLERMTGLALIGDFVSLYLAALNDVDPENIDWLNTLKAELAKVS